MATLNDISAASYDIKYYANDTFDLSVTITDSDGAAVDLSAKTLTMTLKKKKTGTAVQTLSTASEITVSGAGNNIVTFSGTYDLKERAYYYDLENTTDSDTLMYGLFIVTKDIT